MITLYGSKRTRAFRNLWLLEELGVPYERVDLSPRDAAQREELLRLNPTGRVPVMVDGEVVLFESMAINLYLAEKYAGELWPASLAARGRMLQWSFWGMTEVEEPLLTAMRHRHTYAAERRDESQAAAAEARLNRPLTALDTALDGHTYLLGDAFTVADLNLAAIFSWARFGHIDLTPYPNVDRWLETCLARPARGRSVS